MQNIHFECGRFYLFLYSVLQLPGIAKLEIVQLLGRSAAPCREISIHGSARFHSKHVATVSDTTTTTTTTDSQLDEQRHLLLCAKLRDPCEIIGSEKKYEDIFSVDLNTQIYMTVLLRLKYEKRKQLELNLTDTRLS